MALRDTLLRGGMAVLRSARRSAARSATRSGRGSAERPVAPAAPPSAGTASAGTAPAGASSAPSSRRGNELGSYLGPVPIEYAPRADGRADPGEVVWAWVPYEEGDGRGKDRPVLVVGRDGDALLALMLTSKDHDRDAADEARFGRFWMDVGSGAWDRRGRPSEVRLDRVLRLAPAAVRREGCRLDRSLFDQVVEELHRVRGD